MKKFSVKDVIFISVLLIIGIIASVFIYSNRKPGKWVEITVDGEMFGTYDLSNDRIITINMKNNRNTLIINDGCIYMANADCPDKICVNSGKKSMSGDQIVCLPNRVYVSIQSMENDVDSISN